MMYRTEYMAPVGRLTLIADEEALLGRMPAVGWIVILRAKSLCLANFRCIRRAMPFVR